MVRNLDRHRPEGHGPGPGHDDDTAVGVGQGAGVGGDDVAAQRHRRRPEAFVEPGRHGRGDDPGCRAGRPGRPTPSPRARPRGGRRPPPRTAEVIVAASDSTMPSTAAGAAPGGRPGPSATGPGRPSDADHRRAAAAPPAVDRYQAPHGPHDSPV